MLTFVQISFIRLRNRLVASAIKFMVAHEFSTNLASTPSTFITSSGFSDYITTLPLKPPKPLLAADINFLHSRCSAKLPVIKGLPLLHMEYLVAVSY